MDDFDDKMDDFFTYSIISGKSDDDEKASKRKEDCKGNESQGGNPQKGKKNDNWKIYVVVFVWLFVILCIICGELFLRE